MLRYVEPRTAVTVVFFTNGAVLGTWFARIPAAAEQAQVGPGQLRIALLGMAAGALVAFQLSAALSARAGSAVATTVFGLVFAAALVLPALSTSLPALLAALVVLGAGNGGMDVAMNAQGLEVEQRAGRPVLSSMHGFFSLGGLAGAAAGGVVAGAGISLLAHFTTTAVIALVILAAAHRHLIEDSTALRAPDRDQDAPQRPGLVALPPRALWGIGAIALCAAVGEGAMADWSALYLHQSLGTTEALAATGYAAFSATMLIGRFAGDALRGRARPITLVQTGSTLAAVGLGTGLAIPSPIAAVGLGLSIIAPLVFAAASHASALPPGQALAAVATMGYTGFLAGPPLIGLLATATTLRTALFAVVILCAIAALLSRRTPALRHRDRDRQAPTGHAPSTHRGTGNDEDHGA